MKSTFKYGGVGGSVTTTPLPAARPVGLRHNPNHTRLFVHRQPRLTPQSNVRFSDRSIHDNPDIVLPGRFRNRITVHTLHRRHLAHDPLDFLRIHVEPVSREHVLDQPLKRDDAGAVFCAAIPAPEPAILHAESAVAVAHIAPKDRVTPNADFSGCAVGQFRVVFRIANADLTSWKRDTERTPLVWHGHAIEQADR